jgi:hypothetical protein
MAASMPVQPVGRRDWGKNRFGQLLDWVFLISTIAKVLPSAPNVILSPFFRSLASDAGRTLHADPSDATGREEWMRLITSAQEM